MAADGILFGKELLHKGLVNNCDHARGGGVLVGDAAAANDGLADSLEEMGADAVPGRTIVLFRARRRTTLHIYSLSPIVSFQRAVESDADTLRAGQCCELSFQLLVERAYGIHVVSGAHGINVDYVTVGCGDAEILPLKIAQGLRHESGPHQEHQGKGRLQDN